MGGTPDALIGLQLGSCVLERPLGLGGMGAVYLARQSRPRRQVAVKVLRQQASTEPAAWHVFLARFRREADATAALDHANIVPIYEFGEQDQTAYLVMPYLPDGSLAGRIAEEGPLPLPRALTYVAQAAAALDYAHSHGIVHRDVKPSNLLLHPDGRLLLADFGIARPLDRADPPVPRTLMAASAPRTAQDASLTQVGMAMGTPEYMAPEQIRGGDVGPAADLYALGAVTYAILTGHSPFGGGEMPDVLRRQLSDPPMPLRTVRPDIPARVEEAIFWALAKDAQDRPRSGAEFAQALRDGAHGGAFGGLLARMGSRRTGNTGAFAVAPASGGVPLSGAFGGRVRGGTIPMSMGGATGGSGDGAHLDVHVRPPTGELPAGGALAADADPTRLAATRDDGAYIRPNMPSAGTQWPGSDATLFDAPIAAYPSGAAAPWPAQAGERGSASSGRGRGNTGKTAALAGVLAGAVVLLVAAVLVLTTTFLNGGLGGGTASGTPGTQGGVATRSAATATITPKPSPTVPSDWLSVSPASITLNCSNKKTRSATVTLQNVGPDQVDWKASRAPFGITINPTSGQLDAQELKTVTITLSSFSIGDQSGEITFAPQDDSAGSPASVSYTTQGCFGGGG